MTVYRGPRGLHRLLEALGQPTRHRIYDLLRQATRPMTRAEVAEGLGIGLRLAAFHLDKLVEEGLLATHYARPPGRAGGPGAGRPAKQYAANASRFDITVPARRYDIAAHIMLAAVASTPLEQVLSAARDYGETIARQHGGSRLETLLLELGYEPETVAGGDIQLTNCPFHELAEEARQETCTMNQAFLAGVASVAEPTCTAALEPIPGRCCVQLKRGSDGHD